MRINRLDLMAFGCFTEKSLDLSEGDLGLHLIYGDNEAGKSTSLRALIGWLFGISVRTKDNFLHANAQLRIGGELQISDGEKIEFIRRKGNKDTLLAYGSDDLLEDSRLTRFLPAGLDESLFTKLWGIDHARLIAGGQELLEQSGDLGQALFSAAVGTANFREILEDMQNRAVDVFKPRGSKSVLNKAIFAYKNAQKEMRDARLPVSRWKALQKELSNTKAGIKRIEREIKEKSKQRSRLERVNRVKGALAQRRNCLTKIEELGAVRLLPEDFADQRKKAAETLQTARDSKKNLETKLEELNKESESLSVRDDLLKNEDTISRLHKELGAVEKAIGDLPGQKEKRRLLRNEARSILKGIRPDLGLDAADKLRPILNHKKWIWGLAQKHSLLIQKQEDLKAALRVLQDEQKSLKNKLENKSQRKIDLTQVKAAMASAQKAGDIEQRRDDIKTQALEGKKACENEFARLGRYTGSADDLLSMALPVFETLDRFEKENDEIIEKSNTAARKKQALEDEKKQDEQELKDLLLKEDVPKIADLKASRKDRDQVWSFIKQKYIQQRDMDNRLSEYTAEADLSSVYEEKVAQADHISDRLRLDADKVVKRAGLEARIDTLDTKITDLSTTLKTIKENKADYNTRWAAIWTPLNIAAGTPREMTRWVLKAEKLIENIQTLKGVLANEKKLSEECDQRKESLLNQITRFDPQEKIKEKPLEALISLCDQRIEKEQEILDERLKIDRSLEELEIRMKRTREDLKTVKTDVTDWSGKWEKAIDGLGLQPETHPEIAMETFDTLVSFFEKFDASEDLRRRLYGMGKVKKDFDSKVHDFIQKIGRQPDGKDAVIIVTELHRNLNHAREARASLNRISTQTEDVKKDIREIKSTIRNSQEKINKLKKQARVDTVEALIRAEEKSNQKRALQRNIETLEAELNRNGDGLSIEALEAELKNSEIDAIEGEIGNISIALTDLQSERDDLRDRRQTVQNEIKGKDNSALAANASEEAEGYLSSITLYGEHYLRFKIAALILEQQIQDYRKENQAPVLGRAGELFSTLTLGSYAGLRDELDSSGKPILLGVRPDDQEVSVDGMSDGSRDQLYLALRLATLEQHLKKNEPMPFVVDDILIGFDDDRTRVCLDVLAELSTQIQVLLFTHHRRVLTLAESCNANSKIFHHELA